MITLSDFISDELITIDIDGRVFKFKEMNGEDYDNMMSDCFKYNDENKSFNMNLSVKNKHYLKLIVETPYPEFNDPVKITDKIKFLNTLKKSIRVKLLKEIKKVIDSGSDVEKN